MLRAILLALILSTPAAAEMRTWTDVTGKHTIRAEFVHSDGTTVDLKTEALKTISVPLDRLSQADRDYVKKLIDSNFEQAGDGVGMLADPSPDSDSASSANDASANVFVYVSPNGTRYHTERCSHVRNDSVRMSLSDAVAKKLKPCIECHRDLVAKTTKEPKEPRESRPRPSYNRGPRHYSPPAFGYNAGGSRSVMGGGYGGGMVHVNGYTRKDGTHVNSYYRRPPSR